MFYFSTEPRLKWNKIVLAANTILLANVRYMLSPVCLSSVTLVRSSQAFEILGNFYAIWYLGHPLTSMKNFTEIVPGNPSVGGGVKRKRGSQIQRFWTTYRRLYLGAIYEVA